MRKIIPLIIIVSLLLTGCGSSVYSNYRDVEQLQLIRTVGIDVPEDGQGVILSVSSGADTGENPPLLLSVRESSVVTAAERLQEYAARETLYFAHTRFLLLGQSAAENGIAEYLDYVQRSGALREDVKLFLVQDAEAKTLITGSGEEKYDVTDKLDALLRDLEKQNGEPVFSCAEVSRAIAENGAALVHAIAPAAAEGVVFSGGKGLDALSMGYGILRGDTLAGWITGDAAIGAELLLGSPAGGAVTVSVPDAGRVTLTLRGGGTKLTPEWDEKGNLVSVRAAGEISAEVTETEHPAARNAPGFEDAVLRALEKKCEKWLRDALALASRLNADAFALGRTLRRQDARAFDAMPRPWAETFPLLLYNVSVRASLPGEKDSAPSLSIGRHGEGAAK